MATDRVGTPVSDVVDVLHGEAVADPYRWLEDGDDPAVAEWTARQNERFSVALAANSSSCSFSSASAPGAVR